MSEEKKETQTQETNEEIKENLVDEVVEEETKLEEVEGQADLEIEQLKKEIETLEDKNLRLQAEMANMRQRYQKEREDAAKYRSQDLAKALLPAIDNLERALLVEVEEENSDALKKGVEMTLQNLKETLSSHGIEEIAALGEIFDPNIHQAVQTVPSDENNPAETIVQELQKGYKLHDRILRPAMVIVAQ